MSFPPTESIIYTFTDSQLAASVAACERRIVRSGPDASRFSVLMLKTLRAEVERRKAVDD